MGWPIVAEAAEASRSGEESLCRGPAAEEGGTGTSSDADDAAQRISTLASRLVRASVTLTAPRPQQLCTAGAAETALARGIPALAVSQGVDNGTSADFSQSAKYLVGWVQAHRTALLATKKGATKTANGNLNIPTCATGHIRGPVDVTVAASFAGYSINTVNCSGAGTKPKTDVQAFVNGFAGISKLQPVNPPH